MMRGCLFMTMRFLASVYSSPRVSETLVFNIGSPPCYSATTSSFPAWSGDRVRAKGPGSSGLSGHPCGPF